VKLILILVGLSAATALAQSRARDLAPILERRLETPDVVSFQVALTVAIPWAFVTAEAPLGKVALAPLDGAVKFTVRPDNSSPQGPTTWTFKATANAALRAADWPSPARGFTAATGVAKAGETPQISQAKHTTAAVQIRGLLTSGSAKLFGSPKVSIHAWLFKLRGGKLDALTATRLVAWPACVMLGFPSGQSS